MAYGRHRAEWSRTASNILGTRWAFGGKGLGYGFKDIIPVDLFEDGEEKPLTPEQQKQQSDMALDLLGAGLKSIYQR